MFPIIISSATVVGLYAIIQNILYKNGGLHMEVMPGRPNATFAEADWLGMYLVFVIAIGMPVMLSEFTIGRKAQLNPFGSFKKLAPGKPWCLAGLMGVVAAFIILAFYSTVAGWTLEYIYQSIINGFANKNTSELSFMFNSFKENFYVQSV